MPLSWNGLHAKGKELLTLHGTFHSLSADHANYVRALIDGDSLLKWHDRKEWSSKADRSKRGAVKTFDSWHKTAYRMVENAESATKQSGKVTVSIAKTRYFGFASKDDMAAFVEALLRESEKVCALTGLTMILDDDDGDSDMRASLDRIDSDGHYDPDNLQVVCWFANRWKSASDNAKFLRLIACVRSAEELPPVASSGISEAVESQL